MHAHAHCLSFLSSLLKLIKSVCSRLKATRAMRGFLASWGVLLLLVLLSSTLLAAEDVPMPSGKWQPIKGMFFTRSSVLWALQQCPCNILVA
jgi:hypothetical protein